MGLLYYCINIPAKATTNNKTCIKNTTRTTSKNIAKTGPRTNTKNFQARAKRGLFEFSTTVCKNGPKNGPKFYKMPKNDQNHFAPSQR